MASALYDYGRDQFLEGAITWSTADIRVILIDTGAYTVDLATHQDLADVAGGARIATSAASIQNKTASGAGVADGDDITFSTVSGATVEAIILYVHTGVEATSTLVCYIDSGTGLPFTPNGGDVTVQWDSGANKIFKL